MSISFFVNRLFESGTAYAGSWDEQEEVPEELEAVIKQAHLLARAEAAYESPQLDVAAAAWSLKVLAWGCSVFIDRTEVKTDLPAILADHEPQGESPEEQWSVDLGFRFLHSLIVRCQHIGPYDALLEQLITVGKRWPLAVVGVKADVEPQKLQLLLADKCLRTLLVDRIVERNDEQLANHPLLAAHVAQAVGAQVLGAQLSASSNFHFGAKRCLGGTP